MAKNRRLKLPNELTIYEAAEVYQQMLQLLAKAKPFEIDASDLEEIDTAGIQLLMWLQKTARQMQINLQFTHVSKPLHEAINLLALTALFVTPPEAEV